MHRPLFQQAEDRELQHVPSSLSDRSTRYIESIYRNDIYRVPDALVNCPGTAWSAVLPPCNAEVSASAGGLTAVSKVLANLPADFPAAVVLVQHLDPRHRSLMADILSRRTALRIKQAEEGEEVVPGTAYVAPPNRHMLINADGSVSLTQTELVHFVRPSADLLFESVAASYRDRACRRPPPGEVPTPPREALSGAGTWQR
jgi:hypothetical protein